MVFITRQMQNAIEGLKDKYQGLGTWLFKLARGQTMPQEVSRSVDVTFFNANEDTESDRIDFKLRIVPEGADEMRVCVDDNMCYTPHPSACAVTFFHNDNSNTWVLKFPPHTSAYHGFVANMKAAYEHNQGDASEPAAAEAAENEEATESEEAGEESEEAEGRQAPPMESGAEHDGPAEGELDAMHEAAAAGYTSPHSSYSAMVMGAARTSYLQSGATFDVMSNKTGGFVSSGQTVSFTLPDRYSTPLTSRQAILGAGETSMLMLSDCSTCSSAESTKLYVGDLERETVVRTLDFNKNGVQMSQAQICAESKDAQLIGSSRVLSLDHSRLAKWDLRTQQGIVQWQDGKEYASSSRTKFTCMATSGAGHVAVGSADGKIRLYKADTLTKAKTTIPGTGKPITAIDITFDSRWILATTDDYLLVIGADFEGRTHNAFAGPGAKGDLRMRLLRLKPADERAPGLAGCAFKASRGEYTIMWNFRRVKTSAATKFADGGYPIFEEYHLSSRRQQAVVDSAFMHHRYAPPLADALVVATPSKVFTLA